MKNNLDKNRIGESIRKARPQDLLYVTVNPTDKDSKKNALYEFSKFVGSGATVVVIRQVI